MSERLLGGRHYPARYKRDRELGKLRRASEPIVRRCYRCGWQVEGSLDGTEKRWRKHAGRCK